MDINEFLAEIAGDAKIWGDDAKMTLMSQFATSLFHQFDTIEPANQQVLKNLLVTVAKSKDPFRAMLATSFLYSLTGDKKTFKHLLKLMTHENLDGFVLASIIRAIVANMWAKTERSEALASYFTFDKLMPIHEKAVERATRHIVTMGQGQLLNFEPSPQIAVIICLQFLSTSHAPSRDALENAYFLKKEHGMTPVLINGLQFSPHPMSPYIPSWKANHIEGRTGAKAIEYRGESFSIYEPKSTLFNALGVLECLAVINKLRPGLIISIGFPNLLGDILAQGSGFSILQPTANTLPMATHMYSLIVDELNERDKKLARDFGVADKIVMQAHPGFEVPEKQGPDKSRADLGLPEGRFLYAVMGWRLDREIDDAFTDFAKHVCGGADTVDFVFVGRFERYEEWLAGHDELQGRTHFIGSQPDLMAVMNIFDGYINPNRNGGGSTIIYAMAAGVPSLSLTRGDAYIAVKNFPALKSYADMAEAAIELAQNDDIRAARAEKSVSEAAHYTSRSSFVGAIVEKANAFYAGTLKPLDL